MLSHFKIKKNGAGQLSMKKKKKKKLAMKTTLLKFHSANIKITGIRFATTKFWYQVHFSCSNCIFDDICKNKAMEPANAIEGLDTMLC